MNLPRHHYTEYALTGQISPFESSCKSRSYSGDVGKLYLMIQDALELLSKTWYQSPHWESPPTQEQLDQEDEYLEETYEARERLKSVVKDIAMALTGEEVRFMSDT